jgi:CrcB protein
VFCLIYLFIGIGGIVGSLLRYCLATVTSYLWNEDFPLGTLLINVTGAFLLGWFTNRFVVRQKLHPYFLTAFTSGVVGSYTTFSTFCVDTVKLIEQGAYISGLLYMAASLFGGLLFVKLGMRLGEKNSKRREC